MSNALQQAVGAHFSSSSMARARAMTWTAVERIAAAIRPGLSESAARALYKAGHLGDFDTVPAPGLWILEIQIAHPHRPFSAFYEDLLA